MTLTTKQEKFAQEWFSTGNKSEAYRRAYNTENMAENVINVKATELSQNGKVAVRYKELVEAAQKRNETTVDVLDKMAKNAWAIAKEDRSPSAMNQSVAVLAKLHGLNQPEKISAEINGTLEVAGDVLYKRKNKDADAQ